MSLRSELHRVHGRCVSPLPRHLDLTGTDVVENYFSKNGQWVGNQHIYTYGRMQQNLSHMIRLEQIRAHEAAPEFAKPHPKGEVIWTHQYDHPWQPCDLTAYPTPDEARDSWNEGSQPVSHSLNYSVCQGLALLTLSWDKNWDSHSLVNGCPSFYPRIALVAPSPGSQSVRQCKVSLKSDIIFFH